MSTKLIGILFVVLMFVGCTTAPPTSIPPSPQPVPIVPWSGHLVHKIPFQLGPGVEIAGMELTNMSNGSFPVATNANDLYAEARWTCSVPLCDLVMKLRDGNGTEQVQSIGTNKMNVRLTGPQNGTWTTDIGAANVLVDAQGEIRVTVFYNELVAPEYTAFNGTR